MKSKSLICKTLEAESTICINRNYEAHCKKCSCMLPHKFLKNYYGDCCCRPKKCKNSVHVPYADRIAQEGNGCIIFEHDK